MPQRFSLSSALGGAVAELSYSRRACQASTASACLRRLSDCVNSVKQTPRLLSCYDFRHFLIIVLAVDLSSANHGKFVTFGVTRGCIEVASPVPSITWLIAPCSPSATVIMSWNRISGLLLLGPGVSIARVSTTSG